MSEVYHEELLDLLRERQGVVNSAINEVNELIKLDAASAGGDLAGKARTRRIQEIKAKVGVAARDYQGNSRPIPTV